MKKFFTFIAALAMTAGAFATDYTDALEVSVNGVSTTQTATISIDQNEDGTYNFSLKNFILDAGGGQLMPIGNINLDSVQGIPGNGVTSLCVDRDITIANGDQEGVGMWMGPMLGVVPVRMIAELRDSSLYTLINIDMMSSLNQIIQVTFGGGYQIPNSGFEDYYTYNNSGTAIDEPLHWHSFASAGGSYAAFVSGTAHTFQSADVRPGSTGSKSLSVKATSIFGIIANGTVTTGRMNAGALSATDTNNHAELDLSNTDKDGNGDPFYVELNGQPDSLALWVKYGQGTANTAHPYATVSAIITDGTYYQDPEDKAYTNKLAEAKNTTIASTNGEWQRIVIPFTYIDRNVNGKAILVTISTNADAGQGSNGDSILVDDISLIYNTAQATAISIKGDAVETFTAGENVTLSKGYDRLTADDIAVTTDNENAKVFKTLQQNGDNVIATIKVASNDLKDVKTYTLTIPNATTGISSITNNESSSEAALAEIYTIGGQRVQTMEPGKVYIVKQNGKVDKILR